MATGDNVIPLKTSDAIEQEAALWLVRLDRGALTVKERQKLHQWLSEDDQHSKVLLTNLQLWEGFDEIIRDLGIASEGSAKSEVIQQERPTHFLWRPGALISGALATSLLLIFGATNFFGVENSYEAEHMTAHGEVENIELPDQSIAALNSESEMLVDYESDERRIILKSGEVRFDVAHDPNRPFRVIVNDRFVEAVGTMFVVRIDEGVTRVSVSEGVVKIGHQDTPVIGISNSNVKQPKHSFLKSGEEAVLGSEQDQILDVAQAVLDRRAAWVNRRMIFEADPLIDVIEEFNRYSNTRIILSSDEYADLKMSGSFKLGDEAAFLQAIEFTIGFSARRVADDLVLLERKAQ